MKKKFTLIKKILCAKWDWGSEAEVALQWGTGDIQQDSSCPDGFFCKNKAWFWVEREIQTKLQVTIASWFLLLC